MKYTVILIKKLVNLAKKIKIKNIFFKLKFNKELAIFSHLTFYEKYNLYKVVKSLKSNSVCVEIGSYFGSSSCFIASALNERGILYCIDTWGNHAMAYSEEDLLDNSLLEKDTYEIFKTNTFKYKKNIVELRGWSTEVVSDLRKLEDKIDFLFIDGDHSYSGVKNDWNYYSPFLREGSFVAFHDTGWAEGVIKLISEEVSLVAKLEIKLPNLEIYKIL